MADLRRMTAKQRRGWVFDSRPVLAYAYFKEEQEAVGRQAAHPRRKARRRPERLE